MPVEHLVFHPSKEGLHDAIVVPASIATDTQDFPDITWDTSSSRSSGVQFLLKFLCFSASGTRLSSALTHSLLYPERIYR